MANDVIINGQTYSGMDAVNLMKTDGTTETYYPDAVRYVSQTLTDAQKAQARANIGIEDSDNVLIVTNTSNVANYTPAEIEAAINAGKAVFYDSDGAMLPIYEYDSDSVTIIESSYISSQGLFIKGIYTVASDKKITYESEYMKISDFSSADVLIVTVNDNVASHTSSEIKAAVDAGKAVFLVKNGVIPCTNATEGISFFAKNTLLPDMGGFGVRTYTVDSNKNVTYSDKDVAISDLVDSAITDLRQSGELVNDVLAALPTWTGGSY